MRKRLAATEEKVTQLEEEGRTLKEEVRLLRDWLEEERWARQRLEERLTGLTEEKEEDVGPDLELYPPPLLSGPRPRLAKIASKCCK